MSYVKLLLVANNATNDSKIVFVSDKFHKHLQTLKWINGKLVFAIVELQGSLPFSKQTGVLEWISSL
jgi:hypothetical protein